MYLIKLSAFLLLFGWAVSECQKEDLNLAPVSYSGPPNVCEAPFTSTNCSCPSSMFECVCHRFGTCKNYLNNSGCIEMSKVFNQLNDCGDWSDELSKICPADRFQCDCFNTTCKGSKGCILKIRQCDRLNTCGDWSDEINCGCPNDTFECSCFKNLSCSKFITGCIPKNGRCNGFYECADGSDEINCTCPAGTFECPCYRNRSCRVNGVYEGCHSISKQCDGINDCGDWSDEENCTCANDQFECSCYKTGKCSVLNGCISTKLQCNRVDDCGDLSDEFNCSCPSKHFKCSCLENLSCPVVPNFEHFDGCVPESYLCDGFNHCGDWSDEANCTIPSFLFECTFYKNHIFTKANGLISSSHVCDGFMDCADGSDEINCSCRNDQFKCACRNANTCKRSTCLPESVQCNGVNDCGDWSDEINCMCPTNMFECHCNRVKNCTRRGCFSKSSLCNGISECEDNSDETICTCPARQFTCECLNSRTCIEAVNNCVNHKFMCDGTEDCFDGSDENHHICNCSGNYARCPCENNNNKKCPQTGRCIPFDWISDGFVDCSDGSDEACKISNVTCGLCDVQVTTCPDEQSSRYLVHHTRPIQCKTVSSKVYLDNLSPNYNFTFCSTTCGGATELNCDLFICKDGSVILSTDFCNGRYDCSDKSDEIKHGFGLKCLGKERSGLCVLPQINIYDSVAQCLDTRDVCFVDGKFRCFQCLDKRLVISLHQVCDGIVDCFDLSDEYLCENQTIYKNLIGSCSSNEMLCDNLTDCRAIDNVLCNSSTQCTNDHNTKYCFDEEPKNVPVPTKMCNLQKGISLLEVCLRTLRCMDGSSKCKDCKEFEDFKKYCPVSISSINSTYFDGQESIWCDGEFDSNFDQKTELFCKHRFHCPTKGRVNIPAQSVCDGVIDCDDSSDEYLKLCQAERYYCKSSGKISIDKKRICDGKVDCDDGQDESRCNCNSTRFYCISGDPLSIDLKLVQNGIEDCSDASDECVNLSNNPFADINEMIANPFFRAFFWMMALLSLCGNATVFVTTIKRLCKVEQRKKNVAVNSDILVLNLCFSDFLMGIYLIFIIIQTHKYSGSYCYFDKSWRSSSLCSGLGVLAIVSTEASALTMVTVSTYRLISAYRPFLTKHVRHSIFVLIELVNWIISAILATIPLLKGTAGYFVSVIWFPNNFYKTDLVSKDDIFVLSQKIVSMTGLNHSISKSWEKAKENIEKSFPFAFVKEFGYYGETSVCLPRLFATSNEDAWGYSTFLITLNFVLFVYMAIAYVLLYKKANSMNKTKNTDFSSKMQKRISRLIVTDFCCWIPVCVMGYLSVGGIKMPAEAYVISACLLLPINSAINPILYSKTFETIVNRGKHYFVQKCNFSGRHDPLEPEVIVIELKDQT